MKKKTLFYILLVLMALALIGYIVSLIPGAKAADDYPQYTGAFGLRLKKPAYNAVIDPGHGGYDPGTLSLSGLNESDLNLDVSLKMNAFMRFLGLSPSMTRSEDISLRDPESEPGEIKIAELNNRLTLVHGVENPALISIHQNSWEGSETVNGFEVYWGANGESEGFANTVFETLEAAPEFGRARKVKRGDYYILNNANCPSIIVECGFLTDPEDEARIISPEYRMKLAIALTKGYLEWNAL